MRTLLFLGSLVLASLALTACGEDELTCSVLADPENCWAEAALTLEECLPAGGEGVLAADRGSCTFADGAEVVFDEPLPESNELLERFAFTVERDGEPCARFVDTFGNRMELTGDRGTVVSELHPGSEFHLHCPGGPSYEASFSSLFDCAAEGAPIPTDGFTVEQDLVSFSLSAVTTPGLIFSCTPAL